MNEYNEINNFEPELTVNCECHTFKEGLEKGLPLPNSRFFTVV
jgi:hypothetical protein